MKKETFNSLTVKTYDPVLPPSSLAVPNRPLQKRGLSHVFHRRTTARDSGPWYHHRRSYRIYRRNSHAPIVSALLTSIFPSPSLAVVRHHICQSNYYPRYHLAAPATTLPSLLHFTSSIPLGVLNAILANFPDIQKMTIAATVRVKQPAGPNQHPLGSRSALKV